MSDSIIDAWRIIHTSYGRSDTAAYRSSDGSVRRLRRCPSAGARYPVRISIAASDKSGKIAEYVYCDDRQELIALKAEQQIDYANCSVTIFVACNPSISSAKYGARGLIYALLECGHVSYNIIHTAAHSGYFPSLKIATESTSPLATISPNSRDHLLSTVIELNCKPPDTPKLTASPGRMLESGESVLGRYAAALLQRRSAAGFSEQLLDPAVIRGIIDRLPSKLVSGLLSPQERVLLKNGCGLSDFSVISLEKQFHDEISVEFDPCTAANGQSIGKNASGAIVYSIADLTEFSIERINKECVSIGLAAQRFQLSLFENGIACSSIGAIDREYCSRILKFTNTCAIPIYLVLFGHPPIHTYKKYDRV